MVAEAVGGGYCWLQMPLRRAHAARETVAGHRLGALEGGGGGTSPPSNASCWAPTSTPHHDRSLQPPIQRCAQAPDAMRLRKWKDPHSNPVTGTHFSDTVFLVLQKRGWQGNPKAPGASVGAVNGELDELCAARTPEAKKRVLFRMLRGTTALEQKWLIRIILKDMRIQLQHGSILKAFHPSAMDVYNTCTDLEAVCTKCMDPAFLASHVGLRLFQPLAPMLAQVAPPSPWGRDV